MEKYDVIPSSVFHRAAQLTPCSVFHHAAQKITGQNNRCEIEVFTALWSRMQVLLMWCCYWVTDSYVLNKHTAFIFKGWKVKEEYHI